MKQMILAWLMILAMSAQAFEPTAPEPKSLDWIRLTSGEWLRGTIDLMRDGVLEFDSEELDELKIDWEDISELNSPRILTYVFGRNLQATGTSTVRDGVLKVTTAERTFEFSAATVLAIIEGAPTEWNYWGGKLSSSLIMREGNTNQTDLNIVANLRRDGTLSRLDFNYRSNFGYLDDVESVNNHRIDGAFNWFLSRRLFVTPIEGEVYSDRYQNIDIRGTLGAGVGYFFARDGGVDWYVSLGAGYQKENYRSVQEGEPTTTSNGTWNPSTTLETDLTDTIELDINYNARMAMSSNPNNIHHLDIRFEFDLVGNLEFVAAMTWDHQTSPQPAEDGTTPEKTDLVLSYGLGVDF